MHYAARSGPVFITDRGRPAHVLLTFEDYQRLTESRDSIIDLLALPPDAADDFAPIGVEIIDPWAAADDRWDGDG